MRRLKTLSNHIQKKRDMSRDISRDMSSGKTMSSLEEDVQKMLWRKVLIQTVRDAGSSNRKTRADIYKWIMSPDFKYVCSITSTNPSMFKKGLLVVIETAETCPRAMVVRMVEHLESGLDSIKIDG